MTLPDSRQSMVKAYVALAVGVICIGLSAIFVRQAGAPGAVTSFYRMAIAVLVLAWPFYRRATAQGGLPRRSVLIALLGGLFFAADLALWATGVVMSGATDPTLLANTAPLWVGLGATVFFREKLNAQFWAGLSLAMLGAAFILGLDSLRAVTFGMGTLSGLLAGIFYGGYTLITQRGRVSLDSLTYFWPAAVSSAFTLFILVLVLGQPLTGYSTTTYLDFLALGLITQVLGYLAVNYTLGYLPASLVSPTLLGQPVITALLASPLLGEELSAWQAISGGVVLVGVYIVHRSQRRSQRAA